MRGRTILRRPSFAPHSGRSRLRKSMKAALASVVCVALGLLGWLWLSTGNARTSNAPVPAPTERAPAPEPPVARREPIPPKSTAPAVADPKVNAPVANETAAPAEIGPHVRSSSGLALKAVQIDEG